MRALYWEAACVMNRANFGSVLVIDSAHQLLGILTERDLLKRVMAKGLEPAGTTFSEVMTPHTSCVAPEMRMSDAVLILIEHGVRHLPAVADGGKNLGVFSARGALPREVNTAVDLAEFHERMNDAIG